MQILDNLDLLQLICKSVVRWPCTADDIAPCLLQTSPFQAQRWKQIMKSENRELKTATSIHACHASVVGLARIVYTYIGLAKTVHIHRINGSGLRFFFSFFPS